MFANTTIAKLDALGLSAMAGALGEQLATPGPWNELDFADRLALLVNKEADARDSRRLATRLRVAKLRYPAAVEDLDFRSPRGLKRAEVLQLAGASWIAHHHNLIVTGATGCGKTWLACALANAALRAGHSAYYARTPPAAGGSGHRPGRRALQPPARPPGQDVAAGPRRLLTHSGPRRGLSGSARGDRGPGPAALHPGGQQLPVDNWHAAMADPTLAEALLDRVLQASHRIAMKGPSMRRRQPEAPADDHGGSR